MKYLRLIFMSIVSVLISSFCFAETFSFAIIADPHIDGNHDHEAKLEYAVDWIIDNRDRNGIELVFVVGDIAWGESKERRNLETAKEILDDLNNEGIPYIPLIGDNEVHAGSEKDFNDVFESQYLYLSGIYENWQKAPTPVNDKYLQNLSFDYKYCHFVCADFVSREAGDEGGELHDFPEGSWPWFKDDIANCSKPKGENIVVLTHIGMFRTGIPWADKFLFSKNEMRTIREFLKDYFYYVDSNYAGHIHQNLYWPEWWWWSHLYAVRVTDETWYDTRWPELNDQNLTVRLVLVNTDGSRIIYKQQVKDLD